MKFSQKGLNKKFYVVKVGFWNVQDFKIIIKLFTGPLKEVLQLAYVCAIFFRFFGLYQHRIRVKNIYEKKYDVVSMFLKNVCNFYTVLECNKLALFIFVHFMHKLGNSFFACDKIPPCQGSIRD